MSNFVALPADGVTVSWAPWDGDADHNPREHVELRWDNEAWTITGTLSAASADYVLRLSPLWQPRQLLVFRDLPEPDLWLGTDGHGRWGEVNGAHRPDLDGVRGLYVDDSVATLALVLQQYTCSVGDHIELLLGAVDSTSLAVTPLRWRFSRLDDHRWHANATDPPTGAVLDDVEFDLDQHGLLIDAAEHRRRSHPRPDATR